jgi:type I restriction enzyme S subunit
MNNSNTASNWPEIPIGKTGQVLGGRQRSPHATGSPQKYLRVANVFDGYIDSSDVFEMPFSEEESNRFLLAPGDILLNEGQSLELVGRSAIYRGDPPDCCFQNTLIRYRANSDVLPEFAQYTFQNFLRLGKFAAIASQTTSIAHLGTGRFAALPMPVPPLDEQRAIASALSDTDALLAKLDQLIAKKRDIKQAAMQELLTGYSNPRTAGTLSDVIADLEAGVSVNSVDHENPGSTGQPCILKTSAIYDGEFNPDECKLIDAKDTNRARLSPRKDTVLVSRMNTPNLVGEVGYVANDYPNLYLPDRLWMTRFHQGAKVCPRWLAYMLSSTHIKDKIKGLATGTSGSMKNISKGALLGMEMAFPSIEAQNEIATVLSDMDTEITALEARREKTRLIKHGMMQELLSGRVRLI